MKKLALCLLFVAALCACNGSDEATENAATSTDTAVESTADAAVDAATDAADAAVEAVTPPPADTDTPAPAEEALAPLADAAGEIVDNAVDTVTDAVESAADSVTEGVQGIVEDLVTPDETTHNAQNSLDFAGVYQAIAEGDFKEVELFSDGTYRLLKSDDQEVRGSFTWDDSGNIVTLQQSADPELTFFVGENQLWLNSTTAEGGPVFSKQADQSM